MNTPKVWYVTGASQGLGLTLVKKLLAYGYRVAATSRNAQALKTAIGVIDSDRFLPLAVDLNNPDCIDESVRQTLAAFGRIDVLVNNAGYGMMGVVEETTEEHISNIFSVNVLAVMEVTKRVIPFMRKQTSGYIINIGSVAGFAGAPGWAIYSASKAAIAAFSEVLASEVKEFGIKVTVVEPSGFRTNFLTENSLVLMPNVTEGYVAVRETKKRYLATGGSQAGDPEHAAEIFIELAECTEVPAHLFLGRDAYNRAAEKIKAMSTELEEWKEVSIHADFQQDS
jgi:short-subunit dehydrogenase